MTEKPDHKAIYQKIIKSTPISDLEKICIWCSFCGEIHGTEPLQNYQTIVCDEFCEAFEKEEKRGTR